MEAAYGVLLLFDDFEGLSEGWELGDGWSIIQENDNYLLQGVGHFHAFIRDSEDWTDYILRTRIEFIKGTIHVNFRATPSLDHRYLLSISQTGFHLSKSPEHHVIARGSLSIRRGVWSYLRVEIIGGNIKVYINGVLKVDYTDSEPLESSGINFETLDEPDESEVHIDDVLVTTPKAKY
jgi:hypothetical protein